MLLRVVCCIVGLLVQARLHILLSWVNSTQVVTLIRARQLHRVLCPTLVLAISRWRLMLVIAATTTTPNTPTRHRLLAVAAAVAAGVSGTLCRVDLLPKREGCVGVYPVMLVVWMNVVHLLCCARLPQDSTFNARPRFCSSKTAAASHRNEKGQQERDSADHSTQTPFKVMCIVGGLGLSSIFFHSCLIVQHPIWGADSCQRTHLACQLCVVVALHTTDLLL